MWHMFAHSGRIENRDKHLRRRPSLVSNSRTTALLIPSQSEKCSRCSSPAEDRAWWLSSGSVSG